MQRLQGIARVSVRCRPFPGVVEGVRALGYHPHSFHVQGRSRADSHRRVREQYAQSKAR